MTACPACGCYCRPAEKACPHCGATLQAPRRASAARLLGLALVLPGCVQAMYGVPDTGAQAEYGVPDTGAYADEDEDGWTRADGDCDDQDETIHPDADEIPDDGVDSDCDGEDDT